MNRQTSLLLICALAVTFPARMAQDERLPGYYPTEEEVDLMGGQSREMYGRHIGGLHIGGPDAGSLTASGLWRQDPEPTDSFYERNEGLFTPIDRTLGFLAPREVLLMERDDVQRSRLYGYLDPGFPLTRDFNPDLATIKIGPFYLDLLSLAATVLYSDYSGVGDADEDDGWLSSITLDFRGVGRLTEHLYLTMSGAVYFLPTEGEVGFYFGNGRTSFARLAYEGYIGDWEYVIFDEFRAFHPLSDILDTIEHDEIARAGRYRFGRFDNERVNSFFDRDAFFFINTIGAAANGPLGRNRAFDASVSFEHFDYWDTLSFDHVRNWDRLRAHIEYSGMDWWLTPYAEYSLLAIDGWDTLHHSFWLGARGRLTENLRVDGKVGYFMSTGNASDTEQPIGEIGLIHDITANTTQTFYAGVRNHIWEDAEDLLASYARYTIDHQFGSRLRAGAYVQYNNLDGRDGPDNDREGWSAGSNITARFSDYTQARFGIHYDEWDQSGPQGGDRNRWIVRSALDQRLLPYLYATLLYQYEEYDADNSIGYDEHLYMLTLRYLF